MAKILACMAAVWAGLSLAGCSQTPSRWVGVWEGERTGLTIPQKEDPIARMLRRVKFTIRADGTFERMETGIASAGEGRFGETTAYLSVKTILDRPVASDPNVARENADLILQFNPDGTLDYRDPAALTPAQVVLTRTSSVPPPRK